MKVFYTKKNIESYLNTYTTNNLSIGFVPTMGALHLGHMSLIDRAVSENDVVVVSIFVNPTQFNNINDLKTYPRTLNEDLELLQTKDNRLIVFTPIATDLYSGNIVSQSFVFNGIEHEMEGAFRPGHFDGVATVVKKLFEIIKPTKAYFGEKDFQQLQIIKQLVKRFSIPVNIVGCPIFREIDGLAMSSRNVKLSEEQRNAAPYIFKTLDFAKELFTTKSITFTTQWVIHQFEKHSLLDLEYFVIADEDTLKPIEEKMKNKAYRAFIAVYADTIRLIDNLALS